MAERPSVQDILRRARTGAPARPDNTAPSSAETPAEAEVPEAVASTPAESGPPTGRPLSAREKLAAARNRPATAGPTVGPRPAEPGPSVQGPEAATGPKPKPKPARPAPGPAAPELPALSGLTDPKALADAARRASASLAARPPSIPKPSPKPEPPTRRGFVGRAAAVGAAVVVGLAALAALIARRVRPGGRPGPIAIGPPSDFPPDSVDDRWRDAGFFVVRSAGGDGPDRIAALSAACTHLGCTPSWAPAEGRFLCPCHGSAFDREGRPVAGPATRPLDRLPIRLDRDGRLVVDPSARSRSEPGEPDPTDGALTLLSGRSGASVPARSPPS